MSLTQRHGTRGNPSGLEGVPGVRVPPDDDGRRLAVPALPND